MKINRYDLPIHPLEYNTPNMVFGNWCRAIDVAKLEANMDEAIRLLIEARHVCAYPDMNTGLLDEIDTLLKDMGKTNLPELH